MTNRPGSSLANSATARRAVGHAAGQTRCRLLLRLGHLFGCVVAACWFSWAHAVPATPQGLTATAGNAAVTLKWTQSSNPGITDWEYRYRRELGVFPLDWTPISGADYRTYMHTVVGLTNGETYVFQLRSRDANGPSTPSSTATATLPLNPVAGVIIRDVALRRAVTDKLGLGAEDAITVVDMAALTTLEATFASIGDLTGLGHAINLHTLKLGDNSIVDVTPLAGLPKLESLYIENNAVSDLTPLASLPLKVLHLPFNGISDIGPLASLAGLTTLGLAGNDITDISALQALRQLETLNIGLNQVVDITPLANLAALSSLNLSRNQVADIAPLAANIALGRGDEVDLRGNPLNREAITIHIPNLVRRGVDVTYLPAAPAGLQVTPGRGEATLTWSLGPVTVDGYEVRHGPGNPAVFGEWMRIEGSNNRTVSYTVEGLRTEGVYAFELRAVGLSGPGPAAMVSTTDIEAPNQPPTVLQGLEDLQLEPGARFEADVAEHFADADDETLRYQARSSSPRAVAATILGGALRVVGVRAGAATVTVTARDSNGATARIEFRVIVGVALTVADVTAPEGGEATLSLRLTRPRERDTVVPFGIAADMDVSTADADANDHDGTAGVVTIPAGEMAAELTIRIVDDDDIEPARETFLVTFTEPAAGAGYTLAQDSVAVTIAEGVCDRTPAVRDRLRRRALCSAPTSRDLAAMRALSLRELDIAVLSPDDLLGLEGLELLDLSSNALVSLPPGVLSGLDQLATLTLANNRLSTLTASMLMGPPALARLNLDRNRLASLPPDLLAAHGGLRVLRLNRNRLATLPAGFFSGLAQLEEVDLADNPGSPFPLTMTLTRTDAASVAPGPATVAAAVSVGMPFAARAAVDRRDAGTAYLNLAAGALLSDAVTVPAADGPVRLTLTPPALPTSRCGEVLTPCFRGLATVGSTLTLFRRPPVVVRDAPAVDLLGADAYGLALAPFFDAPDGGALTYSATSSDPDVASVSVVDGQLSLATAETDDEASAVITVTATDEGGQAVSFTFTVTVQPALGGFMRGWRHGLPAVTSSGATEASQ